MDRGKGEKEKERSYFRISLMLLARERGEMYVRVRGIVITYRARKGIHDPICLFFAEVAVTVAAGLIASSARTKITYLCTCLRRDQTRRSICHVAAEVPELDRMHPLHLVIASTTPFRGSIR